jgi:hypothetical protein
MPHASHHVERVAKTHLIQDESDAGLEPALGDVLR